MLEILIRSEHIYRGSSMLQMQPDLLSISSFYWFRCGCVLQNVSYVVNVQHAKALGATELLLQALLLPSSKYKEKCSVWNREMKETKSSQNRRPIGVEVSLLLCGY